MANNNNSKGTHGDPELVRIRLKRGSWEIQVACKPEIVKQVVESVLAGLGTSATEPVGRVGIDSERTESRRSAGTCRGMLEALWTEGWFGQQKTLGDAHDELARRGYHYDRTAVAHSLTDLVRENLLTREGSMRSYRYVQKRPPDEEA